MTNYEFIKEHYTELKKRGILAPRIEWYFVWWKKYNALMIAGLDKKEASAHIRKNLCRMTFYRIKKEMTNEC